MDSDYDIVMDPRFYSLSVLVFGEAGIHRGLPSHVRRVYKVGRELDNLENQDNQ